MAHEYYGLRSESYASALAVVLERLDEVLEPDASLLTWARTKVAVKVCCLDGLSAELVGLTKCVKAEVTPDQLGIDEVRRWRASVQEYIMRSAAGNRR